MLPRARLSNEHHNSTLNLMTQPSLPGRELNIGSGQWNEEKKEQKRCCTQVSWMKCKWDLYVVILSFMIDSSSWSHLANSCAGHGGAAYLVARGVCIFFVGAPLLFFEISIGQLSGFGPWKFFGSQNLRAIFSGVGIFLLINSVYKVVKESATSLWPVSSTITYFVDDEIMEGLNSFSSAFGENTESSIAMKGFTHLDALTVISLSITWVFVVLTIICGMNFIRKISYLTLLIPLTIIVILVGKAIYLDLPGVHQGLIMLLTPTWSSLLSLSTWTRAVTDTVLSFNMGFGVITFLASLNTKHKFNCFKASLSLATLHTIMTSLVLILLAAYSSVTVADVASPVTLKAERNENSFNKTIIIESIAVGIERSSSNNGAWIISYYVAIFMLNVDALFLISNMLATSFSNLTWRPVLAVLIGAFLYVICLPLATKSQEVYLDMINQFAINLLPLMGIFLMLIATIFSFRPNNLVDLMEFASKSRLAFRGQSYVFVGFTAALPFILLMSIIDGIVRLDSSFGGVMTIMGRSILCLPWVALLLGPLYVTVCHYRHLPCSKKWRELWRKSGYEDWLYRRAQLDGGRETAESIYELPERVSSGRPISSYYSSAATILASDSAVYSAYY